MPIQCNGFSACIRHFSRRVRSSAAVADRRRVGSGSRSCARCCRSDRRSAVSILETVRFVHSSAHSSQSTGYYKQIKHLVVCQLLDRFTTASRVPAALCSLSVHGFELLPSLRVLCITSSVYRLFEIIFPKISFFSRALKIMTSIQSPRYASTSSCGGVGCRRGSAPRAGQDPGHLARCCRSAHRV